MAKFRRKTKEARCQEIMEGAKKVFFEKGFRYTTMEDVIANTTLSKGGVYQYYKSTKDIMFDIMQAGNNFRYHRTEEIIETLKNTDDIYEIMTQIALGKIMDNVPEKKLYIMFLSEIMYDSEFEDLYLTLEKQSFDLILKNLAEMESKFPQVKKILVQLKNKKMVSVLKYYAKILNGILFVQELFKDKDTFEKHQDLLHNMIYDIIKEIFENNTDE